MKSESNTVIRETSTAAASVEPQKIRRLNRKQLVSAIGGNWEDRYRRAIEDCDFEKARRIWARHH